MKKDYEIHVMGSILKATANATLYIIIIYNLRMYGRIPRRDIKAGLCRPLWAHQRYWPKLSLDSVAALERITCVLITPDCHGTMFKTKEI